jgi:hypothetical protein
MEISENLAYMYGQKIKSFTPNVQIAAGISPNCQFFAQIAHLASKNPENIWIGPLGL